MTRTLPPSSTAAVTAMTTTVSSATTAMATTASAGASTPATAVSTISAAIAGWLFDAVEVGFFTFIEFCAILLLMRTIFQVPIAGYVITLLMLTLPFVFSFLGLGLYISTRVSTREAAGQMAMGTMMPSIFLSGYVFPLDSMPLPFWYMAQIFPTTWLIDAARGVILRGAGWRELWLHAIVLWAMGVATFALAMMKFQKRLT